MKKLALLLLLPIFVFTSCSKDDNEAKDPNAPQLTINSPENGSSIKSGQNVLVDASIQLAEGRTLEKVDVVATNAFLGEVYNETYTKDSFPTTVEGSYSIQENIPVPDTGGFGGKVKVTITVTDSEGATDQEVLELTIN